jgi:hypothetical protein
VGIIILTTLSGKLRQKESAALTGEEEEEVPYRYCRQL